MPRHVPQTKTTVQRTHLPPLPRDGTADSVCPGVKAQQEGGARQNDVTQTRLIVPGVRGGGARDDHTQLLRGVVRGDH
jgi:hypothetical protein